MSEWKGNSSAQELRIGDIQAVAGVNGTAIVYASVERTAPRQLGMDAAKTAAEQALREMHDALAAHFAPVLRWSNDDASYSEARIGEWCIQAWDDAFRIRCGDAGPVKSADCLAGGRVASKRAAEAALRALGVPFRVEGE